MDVVSTVGGTVTVLAKAMDYFRNNVAGHISDTSMGSIIKLTQVDPLTVISKDCANLTYLPEVLNTIVSAYAGMYLQAVAILTKVNNIEVVKILDRLTPNRDSTGFMLGGRLSQIGESIYSAGAFDLKHSLPTKRVMVAEAADGADSGMGKGNQTAITEASNLAVGKMLDVSITVPGKDGPEPVTLPVSVRLISSLVPQEVLDYVFSYKGKKDSISEIYYDLKSGRRSIADVVFQQNLVDEYRKAAILDRTGTLNEIVRRATAARSYGALTNNPSLNVASNVYVMTKEAAAQIERKLGLSFASASGRKKLQEGTYSQIIAIIDPDREMVDFYFRDIERPTTVSVRSLVSKSGKKDGVDITDVMKSLLEGKTPSF